MKSAVFGIAILAAFTSAVQEDEKEKFRKEVIANAEAVPKVWADARFWIETGGRKSGWVRWQVSKGEFGGEPCLVFDYERADYLANCERFRIHGKINEFISPLAFRYGESWREFRVEKGKVGESPFGAPADPGNLVSFPEILATLLPFREGSFKFSTLDHEEKVYLDGSIKYAGTEKSDGAGECHKFEASFTRKPGNQPEKNEMELWVKPDRALVRTLCKVTGKKGNREEELKPVASKDWESSTIELNELRAVAQLSALGNMFLCQRANDLDGNQNFDEWTGDVSGLYRLVPAKAKGPIQVISKEVAMADASPLPAGPEKGGGTLSEPLCAKPVPVFGYLFKVLKRFEYKGKMKDLNDGTNRHEYMFSICAYPAEYGKSGRKTFLIHWAATPYWKDMKGKPAEDMPEIPERDGWRTGVLKK